jgi:Domain of unknown function (DUF4189)/Bacterial TSP3 repeat
MANSSVPHSVTRMKNRLGSVYLLISMVAVATFGGVAAAPSANAVGTWAAISWSPKEGVSGTGDGATEAEAVGKATSGCTGNGGTECRTVISAENACIAVAAFVLTYAGGKGPTLDAARSDALAQLGNATVKQAMCGGNPGAAAKPAPAAGPDRDGDGLSDRDEISRLTNIFLPDTDLDGVNDGDEVKNGTNPLVVFDN